MPPPVVIDGLAFVRSGSQLDGKLDAQAMPRLAAMGWQLRHAGFTVTGVTDGRGKPALRLRASAGLETVCQRCLGTLTLELSVDEVLELSHSPQEIAQAEDNVDRVLASPAMNVAEMVEDELILALPYTPKHEGCTMAGAAQAGVQVAATERSSPFEALERLKPRGGP